MQWIYKESLSARSVTRFIENGADFCRIPQMEGIHSVPIEKHWRNPLTYVERFSRVTLCPKRIKMVLAAAKRFLTGVDVTGEDLDSLLRKEFTEAQTQRSGSEFVQNVSKESIP